MPIPFTNAYIGQVYVDGVRVDDETFVAVPAGGERAQHHRLHDRTNAVAVLDAIVVLDVAEGGSRGRNPIADLACQRFGTHHALPPGQWPSVR